MYYLNSLIYFLLIKKFIKSGKQYKSINIKKNLLLFGSFTIVFSLNLFLFVSLLGQHSATPIANVLAISPKYVECAQGTFAAPILLQTPLVKHVTTDRPKQTHRARTDHCLFTQKARLTPGALFLVGHLKSLDWMRWSDVVLLGIVRVHLIATGHRTKGTSWMCTCKVALKIEFDKRNAFNGK